MCNALSTYLDHDNACAVFAAADSYQCVELKDQAFDKIVQHFALAARSEGWSALTKEQLAQVCYRRVPRWSSDGYLFSLVFAF